MEDLVTVIKLYQFTKWLWQQTEPPTYDTWAKQIDAKDHYINAKSQLLTFKKLHRN